MSGEAYKLGFAYPYARLQRAFIRQTFDLGGDVQKVDAGINQFAGSQTADRLVITVGKIQRRRCLRHQQICARPARRFLELGYYRHRHFDYAAEPWGYTLGAAAEWYQGDWTLRGGLFDLSILPNISNLIRIFSNSSGSAKSSAATSCGGIPARSQ